MHSFFGDENHYTLVTVRTVGTSLHVEVDIFDVDERVIWQPHDDIEVTVISTTLLKLGDELRESHSFTVKVFVALPPSKRVQVSV